MAPFTRVVEQIAEDLGEIAFVALEAQVLVHSNFELESLVGVNLEQSGADALDDVGHPHRGRERRTPRRGGALQLVVHGAIHALHLFRQSFAGNG